MGTDHRWIPQGVAVWVGGKQRGGVEPRTDHGGDRYDLLVGDEDLCRVRVVARARGHGAKCRQCGDEPWRAAPTARGPVARSSFFRIVMHHEFLLKSFGGRR